MTVNKTKQRKRLSLEKSLITAVTSLPPRLRKIIGEVHRCVFGLFFYFLTEFYAMIFRGVLQTIHFSRDGLKILVNMSADSAAQGAAVAQWGQWGKGVVLQPQGCRFDPR